MKLWNWRMCLNFRTSEELIVEVEAIKFLKIFNFQIVIKKITFFNVNSSEIRDFKFKTFKSAESLNWKDLKIKHF